MFRNFQKQLLKLGKKNILKAFHHTIFVALNYDGSFFGLPEM